MYILQVNQAVSDFSNERDKVVGQLREAEVASSINGLFAFYYEIFHTVGIQNAFLSHPIPFHPTHLHLALSKTLYQITVLEKLPHRYFQTVLS